MTQYLLAIDQGTSSSRAILFDQAGKVKSVYQQEVELIYPQDGWVEQGPMSYVDKTVWAVENILAECQQDNVLDRIAAIGITNQRETTILWDRHTGKPVYNAIVWQDRRTAAYCESLKHEEDRIRQKTGLCLDPYFSATKIKWILDNVEGVRDRAKQGDILFGTVDCFLLWHLTHGKIHATDVTNASRTMLYNIHDHMWDTNLLEIFDIPPEILPSVHDNISEFGCFVSTKTKASIKITAMIGDQQSALVGQGCIDAGMVKSTYGTGCFILMNTGADITLSNNGLLSSVGLKMDTHAYYVLEGAIFNAGTAIQFLRDNLGLFIDASETESMARLVDDNGGVYFVPAFTGLGAPYWNPEARGIITGLSRDTRKEHIVRAALEAQAYQTRDLIGAMAQDAKRQVNTLRVDGGMVKNTFFCSFLANILGIDVDVPQVHEATAWGAACLAGVGAGLLSLEDVQTRWKQEHRYTVTCNKSDVDKLYEGWVSSVGKVNE